MKSLVFLFPVILLISCRSHVDAIYYNASIHTVNKDDTVCSAMAVKDGKIVALGNKEQLLQNFDTKNVVNLNGKFVYPGFIDSHCHFLTYGLSLSQLDLKGTTSWKDVLDRVKSYALTHQTGWIVGYGWNQNDWNDSNLLVNDALDKLFPSQPVVLTASAGHTCIANKTALNLAGITANTKIYGGEIILNKGKLTGVLIGNAADSVQKLIPQSTKKQIEDALLAAQKNCFEVGLTTIDEAGITKQDIDIIDTLQKQGKLKMRVYAMLIDNTEDRNYYFTHGPYITDRLHVGAFKFYVDGSLGSHSALLCRPYTDEPDTRGLQLNTTGYYKQAMQQCYQHGFQVCTHAVGDSANRMTLHIYGDILKGPNDKRWRIEHCQVIAPGDFELFADYSIVPSIQTVQATSEMYWAEQRLGIYRMKGAYAYRTLFFENGWLANGSDFPVQNINPLYGFYAATSRQDENRYPPEGFQSENGLTRDQALSAMTIWAAKANFEEDEKGSLSEGKFADFVVLDKDILTMPLEQTFTAKVLATYINGEKVYGQ